MDVLYNWSFALFSANLHRYLPHITWEEHNLLYQKWRQFHVQKPVEEQIEDKVVEDKVVQALQMPSLIALFHLGDHLAWPILLAQQRIEFDILMDPEVYRNARTTFDLLLDWATGCGVRPRFLFSDDPALLLKIRRTKMQGKHVICFADGSSGATKTDGSDRIPVQFLDGTLWVKKGLPYISYVFGMPLLSLLPHVEDKQTVLMFNRSIRPYPKESRECYLKRSLEQLYNDVTGIIRQEPWKWECWSYVHENGLMNSIQDQQPMMEGQHLIQLVWKGKKIWFDRVNYAASLIGSLDR